MKKMYILFLCLLFGISYLNSQSVNLDSYKNFLEQNKNLEFNGLNNLYPIGLYKGDLQQSISDIRYYDLIKKSIGITDYENSLLKKHNFFITERNSYSTFWDGFKDIYYKDLPLYISTDAILHAVHRSYDAILSDLELAFIIPKLKEVLPKLQIYTITLLNNYKNNPILEQSIKDYDIYITVARKLLEDEAIQPIISSNISQIDTIMDAIKKENFIEYPLFSSTSKMLDFSQFTVRGHYTENIDLKKYFKAMIWFGRIELYLIAPKPVSVNEQQPEDIRRQIIDAMFVLEAVEQTNVLSDFEAIDNILKAMVGESDNVKLCHLRELLNELNITNIEEFTDLEICEIFKERLSTKSYAEQKILSQMLWADPFEVEKIKPASAFLLFSQRFVIDSYITGNVVYDRIAELRMLPSYLDVLFALGNNAAINFLKDEIEQYNYAPNLAALRFLVDQNDDTFWNSTIYNNWLQSIRTLNPPRETELSQYPLFMQTAAWWQQKMTTQLASWAQLRHDNLLYAKQSYSGMPICNFPEVYVEPVPAFFKAISTLANSAIEKFNTYLIIDDAQSYYAYIKNSILEYFSNLDSLSNILESIATKEFNKQNISSSENSFLLSTFSQLGGGCVPDSFPNSWYSSLYYNKDPQKTDFIVADVHTSPADASGGIVGWVYHVGTGKLNTAMILVDAPDGSKRSFIGPVMSFYQNTSINFKRYTDEEWEEIYLNSSSTMKPNFVNLYLASATGEILSINQPSLPLGVDDDIIITDNCISLNNFPNPFINSTIISINLNCLTKSAIVNVSIFNLNGDLVNNLFNGELFKGNYSIRWDGCDNQNNEVSKGVYIYKAIINNENYSGKIIKLE